ncbi:MAG: DNA protecting protein DprA [Candidatus Magasanikbacteria bacterium RIFOXYD2_FULL_39_9]|uniref:DNA protecting protein DprA n=1 Tax=Candidatus Magasanikbacteria bacterium RIFOXYD1_FULL_40_23 TaxID=1798705 RepID=A0A1F6PA97_9BACT|nr:MAG: DNA protecting protein DprA [Candidatus Magasanikbacteria bacterium RIFOXYD2_FULL_39_9]OGH93107.1 MAG: DNA protecting protein DprA [Candidatus Magasanikbacteria bacterium RIFOXYD1_FULL_40_23]
MKYHAALAHFPKITYNRYQKLAAYFSDFKDLWEAEINDLVPAGLEANIANEFLAWREVNPIEKIMENLNKENIHTISINEPGYPRLLKEINDPPHTLFIRGILPPDESPTLGVVGTRKFTAYGKLACQEIVGPLAKQGVVIVSGLALGIDGIAHQTTLDNSGTTIAVLGGGVDKKTIAPPSHNNLAEKIIANGGAVVSEYPPGFAPTAYSFPARNRIIAGLSLGTLIIEAAEISGALITTRCALDYNREVFAVPHPINSPTGIGPNNLIKMGARLVAESKDILESLNIQEIKEIINSNKGTPTNPTEAKILECLSKEPVHIDLIIKTTGLESPTVNSALVLMEMRGRVRNLGGMNYIIK